MVENPTGVIYAQLPGFPLASEGLRLAEQLGKLLAAAREAAESHDGVVFGVSHEAPLAAAYVVGRGADFSSFRAVNVPLLGCVRLEPGPPELVDPVSALHC